VTLVLFAITWTQLASQAAEAREANRTQQAIELYSQAVKLKSSWEEGWWFLGTLYYEQDRYRECRDAFRRFTALNKKSGPAFVMLGLCEFYIGEFERSFKNIRAGEELGLPVGSPLTKVAYYHEALLLMKLENYERALFLLSLLTKDGKVEPNAVAAMGIAALRRPLLPKELPIQERALAMRVGEAVALGFERSPADAVKAFEAVVTENPRVPNLHYTFGTFVLGQNADAAIREWKRELEISPEHLPSLVSLTFEYLTRGDVSTAASYAERAMKAAPDHFTSRTAMGRVLLERGDYQRAIEHLELAAKASPDTPQVRLALSTAYSRAGRQADAAREREAFTALKKKAQGPE
jgi:tetratricopeptide (TPR) repeat protein